MVSAVVHTTDWNCWRGANYFSLICPRWILLQSCSCKERGRGGGGIASLVHYSFTTTLAVINIQSTKSLPPPLLFFHFNVDLQTLISYPYFEKHNLIFFSPCLVKQNLIFFPSPAFINRFFFFFNTSSFDKQNLIVQLLCQVTKMNGRVNWMFR